jgi:hypothetical protein
MLEARDLSGHDRAAVFKGGVTTGTVGAIGEGDTSASFNGKAGYVQAPNLGLAGPFSIELWGFLRGRGGDGSFDTGGYGTLLGYNFTHRLLWSTVDRRMLAQFDGDFWSTVPVSLSAWHQIVYVFNGAVERFYVDRQPAGMHATTRPTWNQPFQIGAFGGSVYLFNGLIDDVAFYDHALSADEVSAHYHASGR